MNKKEISEIKKQFTPANCAITRIAGCYVDGEKTQVAKFKDAFLSLPEEEMFKYFEIFRKCLSGTLGKNTINMEFPLETEMENGTQAKLLALRDSQLKDDEMLDEFYDRVVKAYDYGENYLILVIHAAYDIPGKSSDNIEMIDASDEVLNFVVCAICPVSLAKPGLSYDAENKNFRNRVRDWVVAMPDLGFMFPAFNDRSTDIHSLLYYTKSADNLHFDFTDPILGTVLPMPAKDQKEVFTLMVEETLGEDCSFETVRQLHNQIHEITQQAKDKPDPVILDQVEVKNLLSNSGARFETMENFDAHYEHAAGENAEFLAANLKGNRTFEVKAPDITITVSPDRSDLVEKKKIDGRDCLVIPITDEVFINGIRIQPEKS